MEQPFFPTTTTRAEALRWLTISEKLLSARDLMGSKSFATRARDSDPTLSPADQILAIVDTLLVYDSRIGNNNQQDWYSILRLTPPQGQDSELIAAQYRNLALILNPQKNKFPFAEQAFRLVVEAWSVLSNPVRKSIYDKEIGFYVQQPDPFHHPVSTLPQNFIFFGGSSASSVAQQQVHAGGASHFSQAQQVDPTGVGSIREQQNFTSFAPGSNLGFNSNQEPANNQAQQSYTGFASGSTQEQAFNKQKQPVHDYSTSKNKNNVNLVEDLPEDVENEEEVEINTEEERSDPSESDRYYTFWTACPYCYYMYEYPRLYLECSMRCQNCKLAFEAVAIPSPPPIVEGQEGYFCCWGFFPLGVSAEHFEKNKGAAASTWTPFSPMFTGPQTSNNVNKNSGGRKSSTPRVYVDDDEVFVEISGSSGSDDDWRNDSEKKQKRAKNVKGKGPSGAPNRSAKKADLDKGKNVNMNVQDGFVSPPQVEMPNKTNGENVKKGASGNSRKQPGRVAKNFGKLDLNVEFSNETEESILPRASQGSSAPGRGEDDNIEGIGFFEGLDEFLSSLPILNVVGDEKVVKAG